MHADLEHIKEKVIPVLKGNDVAFAGIFGSYARGNAGQRSDIDLLIRFAKPKSLLDLIHMERILTKVLHRKVDLVTERALHPYIREYVLGELQVFYGKR